MERAARLSGSRFGYLIGDTALLALALYRFALDRLAARGLHCRCMPPVLVREEAMYGTGFFPTERSNIYGIESDGLYLTGTSEVALAGAAHGRDRSTSCRSATRASPRTSAARRARPGKDTRGMFRVHQFNKVEMFVYPAGGVVGRARADARASRSRSCRSSACPTASSTSPPATSARRPRRSTTARRGSRRRTATAR